MAARTSRDDANRTFESLYRGHRDVVFRAALRDLRNVHDAEDVTQAAFVDAYRAVLRGSRPEAPRAWLLAIADNVRRRRFRTALKRPREVPLDDDRAGEALPPPSAAVSQLRAALGGLPLVQLQTFVLREIAGLSYEEIATRIGTTVPAVQMALFRARQTLRSALDPPVTVPRTRRVLSVSWLPNLLLRGEPTAPAARGLAAAAGAAVVALGAVGGGQADVDPRREAAPVWAPPASQEPRVAVVAAAPAPDRVRVGATRAVPATAPKTRLASAPAAPPPAPAAPAQPVVAEPVAPPARAPVPDVAVAAPPVLPEPLAPVVAAVEPATAAIEPVLESLSSPVERLLEMAAGAVGAAGGSAPPLPPLPPDAPPFVAPPAVPPAPEPEGGSAPALPSSS